MLCLLKKQFNMEIVIKASILQLLKDYLNAEKAFRHYDYQEALEQAAASLEGIDPDALKKIKATFVIG